MKVQSVSRWDATPIESKTKNPKLVRILSGCATLAIVASCYFVYLSVAGTPTDRTVSTSIIADDLRASVAGFGSVSDPELVENVAQLSARVKALEAENQRLSAELSQLIDHDGVIERLVTHVRALHAQSEATRRDVVNAMMAPTPEGEQTLDYETSVGSVPVQGEANPLLTKARHTIVTPVVVTAPAAVADATPEKRKAKPAPAEPEEGNTN